MTSPTLDLPSTYADWTDYARFAATLEPRSPADVGELANSALAHWQRSGELPRTAEALRSCLWFEYRRWRFQGRAPDAAAMRYCAAIVRELRGVS